MWAVFSPPRVYSRQGSQNARGGLVAPGPCNRNEIIGQRLSSLDPTLGSGHSRPPSRGCWVLDPTNQGIWKPARWRRGVGSGNEVRVLLRRSGQFLSFAFRILWVMDDGVSRLPVSQVLGAEGKRVFVKSKRYLEIVQLISPKSELRRLIDKLVTRGKINKSGRLQKCKTRQQD